MSEWDTDVHHSQTQIILALGTAQTLAWGSTYYLPAILAEPMAQELEVTTGVVFAAFSAALLLGAIVGPAVGRRIDLVGGRQVLTLSSLLFASGLTLLGLADGPVTVVLAWLVIGLGMTMGLYEAAFSALAGIYGRNARGPITGITLIAGLASTICWPISAYMEAELGWRTACFIWAGTHILIGLPLNRFLLPSGRRASRAAASVQVGPTAQVEAGRSMAMALLAFLFAVTWFTSTAMAAHLPRLLQEAGATPAAAITAAALVGPFQVVGRLLEFGFLRRFNPLLSARLAVIAHPIGAVAILGFGAPAAILFGILHGAGNGILTIAKGTLPLAIFGPEGYGYRQGILMVPARFAQAAAPFLFALLIEWHGVSAFYCSIALGLAGLWALIILSPTSMGQKT